MHTALTMRAVHRLGMVAGHSAVMLVCGVRVVFHRYVPCPDIFISWARIIGIGDISAAIAIRFGRTRT